ncbi:ABC transporter permease [Mesorhizobium sp. DCY119]|uniref:ABC transporter permease n=1 Tax=Mesorhizobium sp. DCY119 TaxID=2108445 RepID=UPI0018D4F410|nr:ABC transporter permease [Mesorhizobium sp. DCY119]
MIEEQSGPAVGERWAFSPPGKVSPGFVSLARKARTVASWVIGNFGLVVAVLILVQVALWALFPQFFVSYDPFQGTPKDKFQSPSLTHWFGTDAIGRDLFARVVYAASTSLYAVLIAIIVAFVNGTLLGAISGFVGGMLDEVLMRIVDVLLSIPSLLVSLILVTALGFGTMNVAIAVGFAAIAVFSRVMSAEVLRIKASLYVEAAAASGVRWHTVLWRHVLPNSLGPIVVLSTLEFGAAVLSISALSFLGFGAVPPTPNGAPSSPTAAAT